MSRAENIGPNQNVSGVGASKPKTVGQGNAPQNIVSGAVEAVGNVASNVAKYFKVGKELGLSSRAADLLAGLTAEKFDGKPPKDKGGIIDKKA